MTATIIRPTRGRIKVQGLHAPRVGQPTNKQMFKTATGAAIRPTWVAAPPEEPYWHGYWTIARQHLTDVVEAIAIRDGSVFIEMHYSTAEQCDSRCQTAEGSDCTCSCEGRYHGKGEHAAWLEVGETTLVRGGAEKVVMRTLSKEQALRDRADRLRELVRKFRG